MGNLCEPLASQYMAQPREWRKSFEKAVVFPSWERWCMSDVEENWPLEWEAKGSLGGGRGSILYPVERRNQSSPCEDKAICTSCRCMRTISKQIHLRRCWVHITDRFPKSFILIKPPKLGNVSLQKSRNRLSWWKFSLVSSTPMTLPECWGMGAEGGCGFGVLQLSMPGDTIIDVVIR